MTALAEPTTGMSSAAIPASTISWEPAVPGAYSRSFRFGEWISAPVTPL